MVRWRASVRDWWHIASCCWRARAGSTAGACANGDGAESATSVGVSERISSSQSPWRGCCGQMCCVGG
eukprot:7958558-Prorocentrum_lima.AAC.1